MNDLVARARYWGVDGLGDAELVALVMGASNARSVAAGAALLAEVGGLAGLSRRLPADGPATPRTIRVAAALELGRRAASVALSLATLIEDSACVASWARARLGHLDHEELWMLGIDGQRRVRGERCVARGGLHGLQLHVRDPLRVALRQGASAVVLVHNHPSGDPTPSLQDVEFTRRFAAACDVVATPLVDHVIIARDRHTSMLALGLVADLQKSAS